MQRLGMLAEMKLPGLLTNEEFADAKAKLLELRLRPSWTPPRKQL
jgi:hypothetical protein